MAVLQVFGGTCFYKDNSIPDNNDNSSIHQEVACLEQSFNGQPRVFMLEEDIAATTDEDICQSDSSLSINQTGNPYTTSHSSSSSRGGSYLSSCNSNQSGNDFYGKNALLGSLLFVPTNQAIFSSIPPPDLCMMQNAPICFTSEILVYIKLLKLCHPLKVPQYGFDSILKWANESFMHGYNLPQRPTSRNKLIRDLQSILGMLELSKPRVLPVILSTTPSHPQIPAEVVSFCFREMFDSLLSDQELMREENLLFSPGSDTPQMPPDISNHLGDINTGDWFKNAYSNLCTESCDILCPIIIFIDKTQVDQMSKWSLEPVLFTLGIFNRATRNKSSAWRPLGFIPDESMLPYTRAGVKVTGVSVIFTECLIVMCNVCSLILKLFLYHLFIGS